MNKRFSSLRPVSASGTLLAGMMSAAIFPSAAAIASDDIGDDQRTIVVTGQRADDANPNADPEAPFKVDRSANGKFTEQVRDTPKSMTVIPKEVIEDVGATSFRDIARTTPGVTLGTGEGGNAFGLRSTQ